MTFSVTMLERGRVTIPVAMRRKYELIPGSQFDFTVLPDRDYGILTHLPKTGESYKGNWTFRIVQG
jgi:bifunctional DNA-binding transcriptional regulator/antitoxin component of YhaV-PrlF toxin-antitoxin module